jgi:putative two-component system response regulator
VAPAAAAPRTVLVVDDTPLNVTVLGQLLTPQYFVRAANSGPRALEVANSEPYPDLVLLDVMMPGMDGHEVLRRLRDDPRTHEIPVIFITAKSAPADEELGLELGAVDYISKPFNPSVVLARVRTQMELKQARDRLFTENDRLDAEVQRRMRENQQVRDLGVHALACLAEARDNETGLHIMRTQRYVELLATRLVGNPRFAAALAGERLELIVKAAPLHDIGKVGIPDAILQKAGRLTPGEFEVMKRHAVIGAEAIDKAMAQALADPDAGAAAHAPGAFALLQAAREISLGHHEKWDGSGYPSGLAGDAIPVSARLMALADVFDALMSRRVYKAPLGVDEAIGIVVAGRGTHFDPDIVDAFLAAIDEFTAISRRFADQA